MKYVIFAVFIMIAMVMATEEEEEESKSDVCIPMGGKGCRVYEDCCRGCRCLFYASKCVAVPGILAPGFEDNRPIGPGPYPPNVKPN